MQQCAVKRGMVSPFAVANLRLITVDTSERKNLVSILERFEVKNEIDGPGFSGGTPGDPMPGNSWGPGTPGSPVTFGGPENPGTPKPLELENIWWPGNPWVPGRPRGPNKPPFFVFP
jgi:hypothetical protein